MRAWVTGATGQIGQKLCSELANAGHEVVAFSRQTPENSSAYQWVHWDMSTATWGLEELGPPDVVFHLAAQTSAYHAREDLPADVTTNVLGLIGLLCILKKFGTCPHVISTGAATEVGMTESLVVNDSYPDNPQTFYDVGKVSQRLYLKQCSLEGWIEGTTIRLPNIYGGISDNSSGGRGFLNVSVQRALLGDDLYYYSDGDYIRDYLHVDDAVKALLSAMHHRESVVNDTFVVGTGVGTRIYDALAEIARQAEKVTRNPVRIIPAVSPLGMYDIERRNAIMDASRFRKQTAWQPQVSLEAGLERSIMESSPFV